MRPPTARLLTVAVLALALAALAGCGDDGDGGDQGGAAAGGEARGDAQPTVTEREKPQQPRPPTIVIRDGQPVGGVEELEYEAGERVRFRVRSDVADEVHVHGYDVSSELPAGGTVTVSFSAEIEGIFEVELEQRGAQIAELRVDP